MSLLGHYLLICSKKDFAKLYFDSINTNHFADYERIRCMRHLSLCSLIALEQNKDPLSNSESM